MKILSSPHVHTQFCDGKSSAEEMVLSAIAHGFSSLGFSSHAKQRACPGSAMTDEGEAAYCREVARLQQTYRNRLRIWLGIELDAFSYADPTSFDYSIGSVHYLPSPGGQLVAVDGHPQRLSAFIEEAYQGDGLRLAEEYYRYYAAFMRARRPHIAGHMDLLCKYNREGVLFDESSPRYRAAALSALQAVRQAGALLEVNTGGMARYQAPHPYPAPWMLKAWYDMSGEVILSSDCHRADMICAHFDDASRILREIGYQKTRALGTGDELFIDSSL